jgi:hypothetical protein
MIYRDVRNISIVTFEGKGFLRELGRKTQSPTPMFEITDVNPPYNDDESQSPENQIVSVIANAVKQSRSATHRRTSGLLHCVRNDGYHLIVIGWKSRYHRHFSFLINAVYWVLAMAVCVKKNRRLFSIKSCIFVRIISSYDKERDT